MQCDHQTIVWQPTVEYSRETLLIEKNNSPLLDEYYFLWKSELQSSDPLYLLTDLMHYLRNTVFDLSRCNKTAISYLLKHSDSHLLSLEYFIEQKAGVCRHFALTAYYFLEKLMNEGFLSSFTIELIRMPLSIDGIDGRHAWIVLSDRNGNPSFHFDPFWSILIYTPLPEGVKQTYGF